MSDSLTNEVFVSATLDVTETGEELTWGDATAFAEALGQRLACRLNNSRLEDGNRVDCLSIKIDRE